MGVFEKYLSIWVLLCIAVGIGVGYALGDTVQAIGALEVAKVNLPVAVLVWLMIYPMMVQIDFGSLGKLQTHLKGLALTLTVNWLIKPFSMALFAWVFFKNLYAAWLTPAQANEYVAGAILLGAAPCTAMVFVWSYLTKGNANYTLIQVAANDLVLLVAFVPIVGFLLGASHISIPYETLAFSVLVFVVIPLVAGYLSNRWLMAKKGEKWFKEVFLARLKPISIVALLTTLVLLFAFQGQSIVNQPYNILLIAIPLTLQTYFIFFLAWLAGRKIGLRHDTCAPSALIGASNFFELAVAVAIMLFGLDSGASLATVVGVLIEVPVMLSLVWFANRYRY